MKKGVKYTAEIQGCPSDFGSVLNGVLFGGKMHPVTIALECPFCCECILVYISHRQSMLRVVVSQELELSLLYTYVLQYL